MDYEADWVEQEFDLFLFALLFLSLHALNVERLIGTVPKLSPHPYLFYRIWKASGNFL